MAAEDDGEADALVAHELALMANERRWDEECANAIVQEELERDCARAGTAPSLPS